MFSTPYENVPLQMSDSWGLGVENTIKSNGFSAEVFKQSAQAVGSCRMLIMLAEVLTCT